MFAIISAPPGDNQKLTFCPLLRRGFVWGVFGKEEYLLRATPKPHCWIGWGKVVCSSTTFTPAQPATAPCLAFSFQQQSASLDLLQSPSRLPSRAHLAVRINWLSLRVWPSTLPRWQEMESSFTVLWSKRHSDHFFFFTPYHKRKSSWH